MYKWYEWYECKVSLRCDGKKFKLAIEVDTATDKVREMEDLGPQRSTGSGKGKGYIPTKSLLPKAFGSTKTDWTAARGRVALFQVTTLTGTLDDTQRHAASPTL